VNLRRDHYKYQCLKRDCVCVSGRARVICTADHFVARLPGVLLTGEREPQLRGLCEPNRIEPCTPTGTGIACASPDGVFEAFRNGKTVSGAFASPRIMAPPSHLEKKIVRRGRNPPRQWQNGWERNNTSGGEGTKHAWFVWKPPVDGIRKNNIKGGEPPFPKKAFCASATIGYLGGQCPVTSQAPWPSNAIALLAHTVRSRNTSPLLGCNRCDTRRPSAGRRGMPPDVNRGANAPLAFFPSCSFSTYWIKSYTQPVGPQRSGEPRNGGSGTSPFARCFSRGFPADRLQVFRVVCASLRPSYGAFAPGGRMKPVFIRTFLLPWRLRPSEDPISNAFCSQRCSLSETRN